MAAVPSRCARIGGRSLIGSVRWYDSSHPSLADTLKDLGDQAKGFGEGRKLEKRTYLSGERA